MKRYLPLFCVIFAIFPRWGLAWEPVQTKAEIYNGRMTEWFNNETKPEWNCKNSDQKDSFIVVHPKDGDAENRPLYVVFHSAGHSAQTALECTQTPGNHDIYHVPDGFYGLFVDCYNNRDTDWWWGGLRADEEINDENFDKSTGDLQPVEKRIEDTISYTIARYKIDTNRVYGCGNSMGGSGVLGFGLRHGNIFAAIKANVPAGINHAASRLYFPMNISTNSEDYALPKGVKLFDPPVCVDYSATNDQWSEGHEALFAAMKYRHYPLIAYWGNFGHENNHEKIKLVNDLIDTFAWTEVRRNEAYPVFTSASSDSDIPWPQRESATQPGQINAFFRWKNIDDSDVRVLIELSIADSKEITSTIFTIPQIATADVSIRRLQKFTIQPGETIRWKYGDSEGTVQADEYGVVTIAKIAISIEPQPLELYKVAEDSSSENDAPNDLAFVRQTLENGPSESANSPIIATEQFSGRFVLLRSDIDWNDPEATIWEWDAAKSNDIAKEHVSWFSNGSDAKPVYGTDCLLAVASGGGVALVRIVDKKVLFYAFAGGNPHSAAVLPDGNIVSASSTGNYMKLFVVPDEFTRPDSVTSFEYPFTDTHGLVWDKKHAILWVLGGKELAGYTYRGTKTQPTLEQVFKLKLPQELLGGHDLYPILGSAGSLFVTGSKGIGVFDMETRTLTPILAIEHIKSVSLDKSGNLIVQQPKEQWWSDSILRLEDQTPIGTLNGARFYKARWWISNEFSQLP